MSNHDSRSFLPIGPEASGTSDVPPALQDCARSLYQQAWRDYRQAGCPYGKTDEAMFVWYSLSDDASGTSPVTGKN